MDLKKYSNFQKVNLLSMKKYNRPVFMSTRKQKKYMIKDNNNKFIHFGQLGYEDFTKHKDEDRRQRYLKRTENIKGNWKENKFSPNNLSRNLLW
jgi:hypothetical protein